MMAEVNPQTIFESIYQRATQIVKKEPLLSGYLDYAILDCDSLEMAYARLLSAHLETATVKRDALYDIFYEALCADRNIMEQASYDLRAVCQRDPAAEVDYTIPFLYLKGSQSLEAYRIAHWLHENGRGEFAAFLQSVISNVYGVDIHPQAQIGKGIMIDHATGVVIGQTAVVADNVSIMQDVTLGGTGKEEGDRHPKISEGVLIGAGATVLGNIKVGTCAKIGAGSVVLEDVEAHTTVVGVPARVVEKHLEGVPSEDMRQQIAPEGMVYVYTCPITFVKKDK